MSRLTVYHQSTPDIPNKVLGHEEDITATLFEWGVAFERSQPGLPVSTRASQEEVLATCRTEVDALMARSGSLELDVLSVDEEYPGDAPLRAELQREHSLQGDCTMCLLAGRALLSLHVGDYVYALLCERNDRVVVPAGMAHWLNIGERPRLVALRLFTDPQGWRPQYSGSDIAERFCGLED